MKAFSKLKTKKTYEEVADYLKEQILQGTYQSGDRLPSLRELGNMLGVGQSTVREAISALKTMGLVTIRQGEGTFVAQYEAEEILAAIESAQLVTKKDICDLLEVRKIVEKGIVGLAAKKRTEEDLKKIQDALDEMKKALENNELGDQADWKFHYAVACASHNPILESMMLSISEIMEKTLKASRKKLYQSKDNPQRLYREHVDIFKAIQNGNSIKAEEAMLYHLIGVEKEMVK